ncbi:exonuclease [Vibrio phage D69]
MNRPKNDVVVDIETMGTEEDAVIVSIGAVVFNRADAPGTYIDEFEVKIDVTTQPGRSCDPGTALWWMKASMSDARQAAFFKDRHKQVRLGLALKQLEDFMKKYDLEECWGNAPDFDMRILQHAYRQHKVEFPMPFWKWSDIRTIEKFFYGENTRKPGGANWLGGTAHDALDDCYMEANVIQNCFQAAMKVAL